MLSRFNFQNFDICHFASVGSTNQFDEYRDSIELTDKLVIWSDLQTKGKGRRGREWASPSGDLSFSLYLDTDKMDDPLYELSFLASIAVYDGILDLVPELSSDLKTKWPNDLLLDRKKCTGILIERQEVHPYINFIAIGIGVNLNKAFGFADYPTASLKDYSPQFKLEPYDFLQSILKNFERLMQVWQENGFDPILHRWQRAMVHQKGDRINIQVGEHKETVTFAHISADGSLMYEKAGELIKHFAGDVILR